MFGTTTQATIIVIIFFQVLVLFAQFLFYLSRPKEKSRLRFLMLIFTYIMYNIFNELLWFIPEELLSLDIHVKYLISAIPAIGLPIYFVHYSQKEFNISPFESKVLARKKIFIVLLISFAILFAIPSCYICTTGFAESVIFPPIFILSLVVLIKIGVAFFRAYFQKHQGSKYYKYRVLSGYFVFFTLSFIPSMLVLSLPDIVRVIVFNYGFIIMAIIHFADFINQRKQEAIVLDKMRRKPGTNMLAIDIKIVENILKQLNRFEANHDYLQGKITLSMLAKQFKTNSKYLSQIINTHKGKSFTTYLNDLRIDYAKTKLETDDTFKYYTLKAMANDMGYTSVEAFANAFLKREKIKVSSYVKTIRKNK